MRKKEAVLQTVDAVGITQHTGIQGIKEKREKREKGATRVGGMEAGRQKM